MQPDQIYILCCSLSISGHLPAAIVNGGADSWKSAVIGTSQTP